MNFSSLEEAQEWIRKEATKPKGAKCPCCTLYVKIYNRKLNSALARTLIWMYHADGDPDGWIHMPTRAPAWATRNREYSRLCYWGLAERRPKDPKDKKVKTTGLYRITPKGREFVEGRIKVLQSAVVYGRELRRFEGPPIRIHTALKDAGFDYEEVMKAAGRQEDF